MYIIIIMVSLSIREDVHFALVSQTRRKPSGKLSCHAYMSCASQTVNGLAKDWLGFTKVRSAPVCFSSSSGTHVSSSGTHV